jgi:glycogen(starch) synthase
VRILTVGTLYPPHDGGGGYELLWRSAVDFLRERGHEVRVLATDHRVPGMPDDDVHRELRWYWRDHDFRRSLVAAAAIERHNTRVLRRHIEAFRPDRIGWWSLGGLSMSLLETARRERVPAAAFVIDDWLDYGPRVDGWHRRFGRLAWAEVAHYAFVSAATRDHAWYRGVATPESSIVPAGIEPELIDPAPVRNWDWSLLYVGRLDARKGVATAIDALVHLRNATLTIAGSGPEAEALRARSAERGVGDRVRWLGQVGHADVPALYAAADVCVFPVEWREPWGLVPLEAMGRGRPVVATGRGGSGEYLEDGANALLFDAGDAAALAERVTQLAADPALRARLREAGIATARANTAAASNARIEATLAKARLHTIPAPGPPLTVGESDDADVVLFAAGGGTPELAALHAALHQTLPGEEWAVQGAVARPRNAFARWLTHRGHPPLAPAQEGEVGPVRLDLAHASIKRSLLERAGGVGEGGLDLARRLTEQGMRLFYAPSAHVSVAPTLASVRACLPAVARADRAAGAPWLYERLAHAAAAGPARGRLGRALVAYVPEGVPWLGPRVWANASDHYERALAPEYLAAWDRP